MRDDPRLNHRARSNNTTKNKMLSLAEIKNWGNFGQYYIVYGRLDITTDSAVLFIGYVCRQILNGR